MSDRLRMFLAGCLVGAALTDLLIVGPRRRASLVLLDEMSRSLRDAIRWGCGHLLSEHGPRGCAGFVDGADGRCGCLQPPPGGGS